MVLFARIQSLLNGHFVLFCPSVISISEVAAAVRTQLLELCKVLLSFIVLGLADVFTDEGSC